MTEHMIDGLNYNGFIYVPQNERKLL